MTNESNFIEKLLSGGLANDDDMNNPENMDPKQLEQLISQLYSNKETNTQKPVENPNYKSFLPEPGFCLKTKTSNNEKIFLNICHSSEIMAPKDISENDLKEIISKQNDNEMMDAAFQFRVPMSLGEPHSELDNSGNASLAYDVCVNSQFFRKIQTNATFMGFFMSVVLEGLEAKYSIRIDRNCKMLANKKFFGKLSEQYMRIKSKPIISEVETNKESSIKKPIEMLDNETESKKSSFSSEIPKFKIFREPQDQDLPVEFLVAEIELPKLVSSKSLSLSIGEDRILLTTRSELYTLDIYLPYNIKQDECGAQFDKKQRRLTITMPVISDN